MSCSLVFVGLGLIATAYGCVTMPKKLDVHFEQYEGTCYGFVNSKENQPTAEKICNAKGGFLTSIHSREENAYLEKTATEHLDMSIGAWIGMSDQKEEGQYQWLDNTPVDFVSWALRKGARRRNFFRVGGYFQDCTAITTGGLWYDEACKDFSFFHRSKRPFICVFQGIPLEPGPVIFGTTTSEPLVS